MQSKQTQLLSFFGLILVHFPTAFEQLRIGIGLSIEILERRKHEARLKAVLNSLKLSSKRWNQFWSQQTATNNGPLRKIRSANYGSKTYPLDTFQAR